MNTGEGWYENGTEYKYWARPSQKEFVFQLDSDRRNKDIYLWCIDTFGASQDWSHKNRRWFANNTKYYFADEEDRLLFLLRWA